METAWKVEETCPRCNDDSDVWLFEKDEGEKIKRCYTATCAAVSGQRWRIVAD